MTSQWCVNGSSDTRVRGSAVQRTTQGSVGAIGLLLAAMVFSGCGSAGYSKSGNPGNSRISVTIKPGSATVAEGGQQQFSATVTFDATLGSYPPISLQPGDALVSSISLATIHSDPEVMRASDMSASPVKTVSVLTVVAAAQSADAFRPSYCDRSQTIFHANSVHRNLLPSLAQPNPGNTAPISQFETWYRRPGLTRIRFYSMRRRITCRATGST